MERPLISFEVTVGVYYGAISLRILSHGCASKIRKLIENIKKVPSPRMKWEDG